MRYILKAIIDHPEAFELEREENLSEDELLQIIYSAKKIGTTIQQNSLTITKLYFGWAILLKLGLRPIAMPMGVELLQNFNWNHHYQFAADICNQLKVYFYMEGLREEAKRYEKLFLEYIEIYKLETEMESLYCEIIYKHDHGIKIDKAAIERDIQELENRLNTDSCKYHYYYFHCKCILSEGEDFEKWCLKGLAYFQNLYFKHEIYQNIFVKQLYTYYLGVDRYQKILDEIPAFISDTPEGSKSWYRFEMLLITALLNIEEIEQARKEIDRCLALKGFTKLSKAHQEEWQYLADIIYSKSNAKISAKK